MRPPVQPPVHTAGHPGDLATVLRDQIAVLQEQLEKAETRAERDRQAHQAQLERVQADADVARAALAAAQERWETRLDDLTAALGEERAARATADVARAAAVLEAERLRAELDRLRNRPWWRRLLGPG